MKQASDLVSTDVPHLAPRPIIRFETQGLSRGYGGRSIIEELTITLAMGDTVAITGRNGSGKTTLVKLLAGVLEPSGGYLRLVIDNRPLPDELFPANIGYVAPYLHLYSEFTAREHVAMVQQLRGLAVDAKRITSLFEQFGLTDRADDYLASFSSGMLQRVKFICALVHNPSLLLLDEPRSNLDSAGIAEVRRIVLQEAPSRITVVATNDPEDLDMCRLQLDLEHRK